MARELLFSLTKKDFRIEYFRGSGNGGQKKQKTSSACRVTHIESGAVGRAQDSRSQHENRELAFRRMSEDPRFVTYMRVRTALEMEGYRTLAAKVDAQMADTHLKVETFAPEED